VGVIVDPALPASAEFQEATFGADTPTGLENNGLSKYLCDDKRKAKN
jgi:hypothetical protein